jgi:nucleoside-diphosphate-sugar epimerase
MVQRVLLTGANGFVGSHILDVLLKRGLSVRAVVRSQSKIDAVKADFPSHAGSLDFALVPDITSSGAYDSAVVSSPPFDTIIHAASPFLYRAVHSNTEFLEPALLGTKEILKATKQFAPSVKRVIITSSCAAVVDFAGEAKKSVDAPPKVYTEDDWNPSTWDEALVGDAGFAYRASKKFAELAAWDFIKSEKPNFDLVTLTPPMVYGPLRHSVTGVKALNESTARIYNLFFDTTAEASLPPNGMPVYTDVRDLADAHLLAAETPEAGNQRFIICAGQVSSQNISDVLREKIPELEKRSPKGVKGGNPLPPNTYICSSEKAQKVLGLKFKTVEETFVELGKQLLELEKKG